MSGSEDSKSLSPEIQQQNLKKSKTRGRPRKKTTENQAEEKKKPGAPKHLQRINLKSIQKTMSRRKLPKFQLMLPRKTCRIPQTKRMTIMLLLMHLLL